jgi:hypothetical protein
MMRAIGKLLKDNGLSLAFWLLFALCLTGELLTGFQAQLNQARLAVHAHSRWSYFLSPDFLKGVFGNWQAALLQLFVLIVFAVFLRQRGASHSRKPDDEAPHARADDRGPIARSRSWLYCNSLSVAFAALFCGAFAIFFFADFDAYLAQHRQLGMPALTAGQFIASAQFWFDVFQTWQAEFFAMGIFLILSIFLRQQNSAESKPIWARDDETGETNE